MKAISRTMLIALCLGAGGIGTSSVASAGAGVDVDVAPRRHVRAGARARATATSGRPATGLERSCVFLGFRAPHIRASRSHWFPIDGIKWARSGST